jgi:hypothetical protein
MAQVNLEPSQIQSTSLVDCLTRNRVSCDTEARRSCHCPITDWLRWARIKKPIR